MLQLSPLFPIYILGHCVAIPGELLSPKSYVDVPAGPRKSDYLYTNFLPNFPTINIPFSKEKHPILTKLGAFYNIWPKIHPIFLNLGCFISDEKPPITIPDFAKKRPKMRQAHIRIPCQCEDPPGFQLSPGSLATDPVIWGMLQLTP